MNLICRVAGRFMRLLVERPDRLLAAALMITGLLLINHYGMSTDESVHITYAQTTLSAYLGLAPDPMGPADLPYYGPAFSTLAELGTQVLASATRGQGSIEARHYAYFLSFVLGTVSLFAIAQKFVHRRAAMIGAMLFATQPLLFGHAFINPKDIPFMGFFLLSMALGFWAVEQSRVVPSDRENGIGRSRWIGLRGSMATLGLAWRRTSLRTRLVFFALTGLLVVVFAEIVFFQVGLGFARELVTQAYQGLAHSLVNAAFRWVAEDAEHAPLSAYLTRTTVAYRSFGYLIMGVLMVLNGFVTVSILGTQRLGSAFRPWAPVVTAAIALGLTTSIRVAGPLAGVLVTFVLLKDGRRSWPRLVVYWIIAALVTYATWPALWGAAAAHFLETLRVMADFSHGSLELYQGALIPAGGLPWHFVPWLMSIQFTEPLLIFATIGGIVAAARFVRGKIDRLALVVLALWFAIPVGTQVLRGSTIYSNFRQLLFAVPPLFVLAALGLDWIGSRIRSRKVQLALGAAVLLPGILGIIRLHPYEYIYYNSLVGGMNRASLQYETDYWCTSYREAMQIVNRAAPPNSRIGVHRLSGLARPYAREDLDIYAIFDEEQARKDPPDYLLVCARSNFDESFMSEWGIVYEVRQAGARLAVIRKP